MFVAGFMGSPSMNFIPATLTDPSSRPAVRVELRDGGAAEPPLACRCSIVRPTR
jgi:ABC-type sugar transport system ATPase subunit